MTRVLLTGVVAALAVAALVAPSSAQSPAGTIDIDNCNVKTSPNAGGFTWAYCPIVVRSAAGQDVSVRYRVNLATYKPVAAASYGAQSGTLKFTGGGEQLQNVKFAFKKRTVAQVVSKLKVTLSNPSGATIVDGTATANPVAATS